MRARRFGASVCSRRSPSTGRPVSANHHSKSFGSAFSGDPCNCLWCSQSCLSVRVCVPVIVSVASCNVVKNRTFVLYRIAISAGSIYTPTHPLRLDPAIHNQRRYESVGQQTAASPVHPHHLHEGHPLRSRLRCGGYFALRSSPHGTIGKQPPLCVITNPIASGRSCLGLSTRTNNDNVGVCVRG